MPDVTMSEGPVLQWPKGKLDFAPGCLVMGILNVTPDSFSDGGQFLDAGRAVAHGLQMASEGAAILDIGGESTRPGSQPVPPEEQIRRVVPVIAELRRQTQVPISIDAHDVEVARAALDAGAAIVNDITALSDDRMAELVAKAQVPVILMHMQGTPATMQAEPTYSDVVEDVMAFLLDRARRADRFGIRPERIFLDPGIGFGKTLEHNLRLLKHIGRFVATAYRIVVGTSRKRFLGTLTGKQSPPDRLFGAAATVALCAASGVSVVRVHDVAPMLDIIRVARAILDS
jgi:dihydropteroate synthase